MRPTIMLAFALLLAMLPACDRAPATPAQNPAASARPDPALSSAGVVRQQMLALQHNDTPSPDAGIAIAFRFASPENRVFTGPIERFIEMVHAPAYAPMLNCRRFEVAEAEVRDGLARHAVFVEAADGRAFGYVFVLRKQAGGEFADCWMVDSVVPVQPPPRTPDPEQPEQERPRRRIAV